MTSSRYQLGNEWEQARERLQTLERIHDPFSIRVLERIGVAEGWDCLELGPGAGSMTRWLSERAGPSGRVVALDMDARFVKEFDLANLEVREADVVSTPVEEEQFDLVFTRLTLQHIAERDPVLAKLVRALKPGGWLVAHELSAGDGLAQSIAVPTSEEAARAFDHVQAAAAKLNDDTGRDMAYGAKVYGKLAALGLQDIDAEAFNRVIRAGTAGGRLFALNQQQQREQFLATGLVTAEELDLTAEVSSLPNFGRWGANVILTWGRK